MNYQYFNFDNQKDLIDGVILRKLIIHKDPTGSLVETLRTDWRDVFDDRDLSFAMQYLSVTPSGLVRDHDKWHVHRFQKDRFICIAGRIITALYDIREKSPTKGWLNLFAMGPKNGNEMYLLVIPEDVYHGFMVVSKDPGFLLNFPTKLYNQADEGRVDNTQLNWEKVKSDFAKSE